MKFKKLLPILFLIIGTAVFFISGSHKVLNFETLRTQSDFLQNFVETHYIRAVLFYMCAYLLITAFSLPMALPMTLFGGFLFGAYFGTFYTTTSATIGAICIFLAARYAISDYLEQKVQGILHRLKDGFNENAFTYLLTLRLIPLFPFWAVNIVPALLSVPLRTFSLSTFIGIIPATFVFTLVGSGLGEVFMSQDEFSLSSVVKPKFLIALTGLGILAILPVLWKKFKKA